MVEGFVGYVLRFERVKGSVSNSSASFHGGGCSWFQEWLFRYTVLSTMDFGPVLTGSALLWR